LGIRVFWLTVAAKNCKAKFQKNSENVNMKKNSSTKKLVAKMTRFLNKHNAFFAQSLYIFTVTDLTLKLKVDGNDIPLNEFVESILNGTITGAVNSLKGIKEDWKKIEISIQK